MAKISLLSHWQKNVDFSMSTKELQIFSTLLSSGIQHKPVKLGPYYFYYDGSSLGYNSSNDPKTIMRYTIIEPVNSILAKINSLLPPPPPP
ncbi:hypothetical protein RYA99_22775, partial [Pseudomonas syringae pv. actinidifoliorum]|nr:hypothetical protein [Pseudomonas syringae pv. actinidifoliorum]